jgi:transcriptional adapter 2-alpha
MPGRLEFEIEVDNDAEEHIKDLEFGLVMDYGGADQPEGDPPVPPATSATDEERTEGGRLDGDGDTKMNDGGGRSSSKDAKADEEEKEAAYEPLQPEAPNSVKLKLCLLDIYNEKIDKRLETKAVVFDRGLLEFKKVRHSFE